MDMIIIPASEMVGFFESAPMSYITEREQLKESLCDIQAIFARYADAVKALDKMSWVLSASLRPSPGRLRARKFDSHFAAIS